MDAENLREWIFDQRMNKTQAAQAIGISRPTLDGYLKGRRIPKYIQLACAALDHAITTEPS